MASETKKTFEKINEVLISRKVSKEAFEKLWNQIYAKEINKQMIAHALHSYKAGTPHIFAKWEPAFSFNPATAQSTFDSREYLNILLTIAEIARQEEMESYLNKPRVIAFQFWSRLEAVGNKVKEKFGVSITKVATIFGYNDVEQLEDFCQMLMKLRMLLRPTSAAESKAPPPTEVISAAPSDQPYIDLLPSIPPPSRLLVIDRPGGEIKSYPTDEFLQEQKRTWLNGLQVRHEDMHHIERLKDHNGEDYSNFTLDDHKKWAAWMEDVVIRFMGDEVGYGVFVAPGKRIAKGTVIPLGGLLDFDHSKMRLGANFNAHAVGFSDLHGDIIAAVDPLSAGNIWHLINHSFLPTEATKISNLGFYAPATKGQVQPAKLAPPSYEPKFYKGVYIPTLEVQEDILAGEQLLFPYLFPYKYYHQDGRSKPGEKLYLFAKNGNLIGPEKFFPQVITFTAKVRAAIYSARILYWFLSSPHVIEIALEYENANGDISILYVPRSICLQAAKKSGVAKIDITSNLLSQPLPLSSHPLPLTSSPCTRPMRMDKYQERKAELGKELCDLADRTDRSRQEFEYRLDRILDIDPLVIDQAGPSGGTPLQCAAQKGNIDQIEALLARKAQNPPLDELMALLPKDRPDLLARLKKLAGEKTNAEILGSSLSASFSSVASTEQTDSKQTSEATTHNTSVPPSPI